MRQLMIKQASPKRPKLEARPLSRVPRVPHRLRPEHRRREPALITLRMCSGLPNLRSQSVLSMLRRILAEPRMAEFQAVHYSVQKNHAHFIVEADDKPKLSKGLRSLIIRIARRLNALLGRKGRVFADRYHRRDLGSPTEVKNALRYVLGNFKKHGLVPRHLMVLDFFSSAASLDVWSGFEDLRSILPEDVVREIRSRDPRTWMLRLGWQRAGPLRPSDAPAVAG